MLPKRSIPIIKKEEVCQNDEGSDGCNELNTGRKSTDLVANGDKNTTLGQLEPYALQLMGKLIFLVHENVKSVRQDTSTPADSSYGPSETSNQRKHIANDDNAPVSDNDSLDKIFLSLEPLAVQKVLLAMAECFPRTLEALILHMLEPAAAEVLTSKFDEMEPLLTKEQQEEFYKKFYSVFDDPAAAMNAVLNAKEAFAFQAFQNVLDQYLGAQVIRLT